MEKYIAFLRGINVSGQKLIKMEDLRKMFASIKFNNVSTYIQSGNVIFEASEAGDNKLAEKIEKKILSSFGFEVKVIIRNIKEMKAVVKADPFKKIKNVDRKKVYIAFLSEKPAKNIVASFEYKGEDVKAFHIIGKELYILYTEGMGSTKFTNNYIEKKLGVSATTRNWATTNKMLELTSD